MKIRLVKHVYGLDTLTGEKGTVLSHGDGRYRVRFPHTSGPLTLWRDEIELTPMSYVLWLTKWWGTLWAMMFILILGTAWVLIDTGWR